MGATSELASEVAKATVAPARIGLFPPSARTARPRLLAALEEAYPVCFEAREDGDWDGFDAVVAIGEQIPLSCPTERRSCGPSARSVPPMGKPSLSRSATLHCSPGLCTAPASASASPGRFPMRRRPPDSSCWQRSTERRRGWPSSMTVTPAHRSGHAHAWGGDADARSGGSYAGSSTQFVAVAPAELEPGESLRERLAAGRCLALLALVNFLQGVTRERSIAPPLSAAFVLDDPNLHWPSYGHVRYAELAGHAREHGYHVVIAMSPLDGWYANRRAVRIFKEHPAQLSICVHGNDHLGPELGRVVSDREGLVLARHALARAAAFQRRTGIPFERVMVPPHEQLSEPAARGLAGGFDAVRVAALPMDRSGPPGTRRGARHGSTPSAALWRGGRGREIVAGGLPLLLRTGFNAPREDLVLRAFLGQPLVVYGHHDVLEHGHDVLADYASAIDALGDVCWTSLAGIARRGAAPAPSRLPEPFGDPRPHFRPLVRRLASEARDRARLA